MKKRNIRNKWNQRKSKVLSCVCAVAMVMSACGQITGASDQNVTTDSTVENVSGKSNTSNAAMNVEDLTTGTVQSLDVSDMFTDRDKEVGYDESKAVAISLNATSASCESSSVKIDGSTITITDEGTYVISGALEEGMVIVEADENDKCQIVLNGVTITNRSSACLYVKQADKVFVTIASGTVNTLSSTGEYVAIDENNIDAPIFSKEDLTLNGQGTLIVESAYGDGIVSKDDLVITSGTIEITAASHGLNGKDSVRIASGNITITSKEDGIHSGNDEDDSVGYTYISGGTININAGDDGIHSDTQVVIAGGEINIAKSAEGIEGSIVEIAGGMVSLVSSDDGLNATGGSSIEDGFGRNAMFESEEGVYILISGGKMVVDANGDGLDSNGDLYVTGGEVYVSGPTNSGNGALDYNGTAQITGGILVATGYSGMDQNMGSSSTQGSILVNTKSVQEAGSAITLKDSDGNVLVSFSPAKAYNSVVVSNPEVQVGESYTLTTGTEDNEITMTELIYGGSTGMGGFGGFGGGFRGDREDFQGQEFDGDMEFGENMEFDREQQGRKDRGQMPEGNFNGEMPEMPEGGFGGERPEMPEEGFEDETI